MMTVAYTIAIISLIASVFGLIYSIWINFIRRWIFRRRMNKATQKMEAKERYVERKMKANE